MLDTPTGVSSVCLCGCSLGRGGGRTCVRQSGASASLVLAASIATGLRNATAPSPPLPLPVQCWRASGAAWGAQTLSRCGARFARYTQPATALRMQQSRCALLTCTAGLPCLPAPQLYEIQNRLDKTIARVGKIKVCEHPPADPPC